MGKFAKKYIMKANILTIGDEILIGQVVDTNSAFIAAELNKAGIKVQRIFSVGDEPDEIIAGLDLAGNNSDFVFVTGGLGPTRDDITKQTICKYFNSVLKLNDEVLDDIRAFIGKRGLTEISELNRKQAEVPDKCTVIRNTNGTAPAMWFEKTKTHFVFMPGVPHEMKGLMTDTIIPKIKNLFSLPAIVHKTVLTFGSFEASLAQILEDWHKQLPEGLKIAYLPGGGIIRLRFSMSGPEKQTIVNTINCELEKLHQIIPGIIFGYDEDTMEKVVGVKLAERNLTVSCAESCTGGKISSMITSIPGSSNYFKGSVIAYSNEIKTNTLDVNADDIIKHGAVSQCVAEQMAKGVQKLTGSDCSIAVTGIAGPDGGSPEKPVGTVWIAVSTNKRTISRKYVFGGNREFNILRASVAALNMLREELIQIN